MSSLLNIQRLVQLVTLVDYRPSTFCGHPATYITTTLNEFISSRSNWNRYWEPKAHRKRIFRESFHSAKGQVHVVYPMKQFHNISNKSGQHSISLSIFEYFFFVQSFEWNSIWTLLLWIVEKRFFVRKSDLYFHSKQDELDVECCTLKLWVTLHKQDTITQHSNKL